MFLFEFAAKLVIIGLIVTTIVVLAGQVMGLFAFTNFSLLVTRVFNFITLMLTYVRFLLKLFMVPQWLVLAYVGLLIGIWGVNITFYVIAFIKSIYDYIMQ